MTKTDKAVSKTSGYLYTEQAINKYSQFFDNIARLDTDTVLIKAGIARHELEGLLYDDEIDEKVERRLEYLTQARYTLSPSDGDVAGFIYEQLDRHLESILTASLNSKLYGYSVCELVWDKAHRLATGLLRPLKVIEKPMEWFEPTNDGRLLYYPAMQSTPLDVDITYKYLLQQHRPTFKNPKGKALLSRIYWLWYFKKNGWQFWSKFLERFGAPLLIGKTEGEPAELAAALAQAHNQSIVAMPVGDDVSSVSANGNGEAFKAYDDAINKRIARYLLGQTLTTGVDNGGTYGQGVVHQEQQEIIFNSDKKHAVKYVQHFIDVLCLLNNYAPPQFEFQTEKGFQTARAERDSKLHSQGVMFTKRYYADMYDIDEQYIAGINNDTPVMPLAKPINASINKYGLTSTTKAINTDKQFTPEQQQIESHADDILANAVLPIDQQALKKIVASAKDLDDLQAKLYDLAGQDMTRFQSLIESALMVTDVLGYADSQTQ